jgi:Domain of unknown function (DUF4384)
MTKCGGCTLGPDAKLEGDGLRHAARMVVGRPQGFLTLNQHLTGFGRLPLQDFLSRSRFNFSFHARVAILTVLALLISSSSAQDQSVLKLTTDHPTYAIGKRIVVRARVGQNGFLYLFNIRADGLIDLLVPNRFADGDSRSWAGETRRFPNKDSGWWFVAPEPSGKHHLIAFLVPNGLKLDGLARFDAGNPFAVVKARGQVALEQALKSRIPNGATRADLEYLVVKP